MLQLTDVQLAYEGVTLFEGVTFHIAPGERVALVGANGAGKSSLLKIISGEQRPTGGAVSLLPGRTVAYLPQDSYVASDRTLHDEMLSVFADVLATEERQRQLEVRMSGLDGDELDRVLEEYAQLQADFDRLGGYTIEREVGTVLHGLGFTPNDNARRVSHFSGGWQSRIALGKTLLKRPDLLLLDEPTNHLDLATTEWLEEYLGKYAGAFVVVSHDRYFLERVTNRTLELEQGRVTDYPGPYGWYAAEKQRRREQQQELHERQQREIARQQAFVDRWKGKPTKTSAAQSREKMIARIERVEAPPPSLRTIKFRFTFSGNSGREVFTARKLARAYGEREVLRDVDLLVERGDKIAVIGPNGSGKSTLLRTLAGVDKPTSGSLTVGHNVRRSYFAQHQAELLESGRTVYDEVMRSAPRGWTVTDVRTLLGRFLFSGEDVHKPIEVLSGGERSRVALVKMLLEPANTLLLDEPTNHLDIPTRDMLESAIREYEGTCLVISHDRYFLDRFATKTLEIEGGTEITAAEYEAGTLEKT
jgi:ATP-binding cassette subfamily F protein 3